MHSEKRDASIYVFLVVCQLGLPCSTHGIKIEGSKKKKSRFLKVLSLTFAVCRAAFPMSACCSHSPSSSYCLALFLPFSACAAQLSGISTAT